MRRIETIFLELKDYSVFIKKSIFINDYFEGYSLFVYEYRNGFVVNDFSVDYKCCEDLENAFIRAVDSYTTRGFK